MVHTFFMVSYLENVENLVKTAVAFRLIQPDWGNIAGADTAGLGSLGLKESWKAVFIFL